MAGSGAEGPPCPQWPVGPEPAALAARAACRPPGGRLAVRKHLAVAGGLAARRVLPARLGVRAVAEPGPSVPGDGPRESALGQGGPCTCSGLHGGAAMRGGSPGSGRLGVASGGGRSRPASVLRVFSFLLAVLPVLH